MRLFEAMHPADQRHGLDVVAALRAAGHGGDRELLLAGLLHDASKGPTVGVWHRVGWSLGEHYGPPVERPLAHLPGFRARLRHPARPRRPFGDPRACGRLQPAHGGPHPPPG